MRFLLASCAAAALGVSAAGCRTPRSGSGVVKEAASVEAATTGVSRPCVYEAPLTNDGYTEFAAVSADKVSRMVMTAQGPASDPVKTVKATQEQLDAAQKRISAVIDNMNQAAPGGGGSRRAEIYRQPGGTPEPYCLFHAAGQDVYGTVMLFHGFNDRPQQQAALAAYLFHSGFNVYNVFLANHWHVPGTQYWPRTVYKAEILALLAQKAQNPVNQLKIAAIKPHLSAGQVTPEDLVVINQVLAPELSSDMILKAWKDPGGPEFQKLFNFHDGKEDSFGSGMNGAEPLDFFGFLRDAKDRLDDLQDIPGPVFVSGLSVGGAIVLGLAELDGGQRIRGVVSQAGWLRSAGDSQQMQLMVAGPLDDKIKAFGGDYPMMWDSHKIAFSPASVAANAALGAYVTRPDRVKKLAVIPTVFVTTAVDVSADTKSVQALYNGMNQGPVQGLHQFIQYPADHNVGHAMTDPENYRGEGNEGTGGNHWNMYWRTLYQEHFRFFTTGKMNEPNLLSKDQDQSLPPVKCAIVGEYAYRCNM